jgi:hypothetical protein
MSISSRGFAGAVLLSIVTVAAVGAAPNLPTGVWTDISPSQINFGNGNPNRFTQGMAIDPSDPLTIYVCVSGYYTDPWGAWDGGLFKTTDGGSTWREIGNFQQTIRVRVDPNDPNHLYSGDGVRGGTQGFWRSFDGGETWAKSDGWNAVAQNLNINDVYDIAVDPDDFGHVLVSSHSPWNWGTMIPPGVLESTDGGDTWIVHNPPQDWGYGNGVWFLNNSDTWLHGTQGSGFWRTTNRGDTWTKVSNHNMAHGGSQLYRASTGVLYAASWDEVLRSTDNGASWNAIPGTPTFCTGIGGDGTYIYAHKGYNSKNGAQPFMRSLETDGLNWEPYTAGGAVMNGPFEMAFDPVNNILYSASWYDGIVAMRPPYSGHTQVRKPAPSSAAVAETGTAGDAIRHTAFDLCGRTVPAVARGTGFAAKGLVLMRIASGEVRRMVRTLH